MDAKAEAMRILMIDLQVGDRLRHKAHRFVVVFDGWMDTSPVTSVFHGETIPVVISTLKDGSTNKYPISKVELYHEFERDV
jgi:hypothetical protein